MTATSDTMTADGLGTSLVSAPADIANTMVGAGQKVHGRLMGGVEWYFEHWVDLYEEVRAEQSAVRASFSLDDIMTALPTAQVASDIPGRARLRLPQLKRQSALCEQVAEAVKGVPGVDAVHVSPITGSILALYDAGQYSSLDDLLQAVPV